MKPVAWRMLDCTTGATFFIEGHSTAEQFAAKSNWIVSPLFLSHERDRIKELEGVLRDVASDLDGLSMMVSYDREAPNPRAGMIAAKMAAKVLAVLKMEKS